MGFHHHVEESDSLFQCAYCGKDIEKIEWVSEFIGNMHYKISKCFCGKENKVRVRFEGSGHDNFNKEKNLEMKVESYRFNTFFFK